jgi:dUTP pyrophosphatase
MSHAGKEGALTVLVRRVGKVHPELPAYQTDGAAGMDVRAALEAPVTLGSLERRLVPTGLSLEIPAGFEAQVRPRSGLAAKLGVTVLHTPGTIDSDYRGEVGVVLVNLSKEPCTIAPGDRIAQLVFAKVERAQLVVQEELSQTARGEGGYGSTGRS